MRSSRGISQGVLFILFLLLAIGLQTGTAHAEVKTVKVGCADGDTIAEALRKGEDKSLVITVQGTCQENVTITRDDVTLQGDPATGGAVTAANPALDTILIDGARRVVIDNLTVSGGRNGIAGGRGAAFTVQNSTIQESAGAPISNGNGVKVHQNSQAVIHHNVIENHPNTGVSVEASNATITANMIRKNLGQGGIWVLNSGSARIGLTDADTAAGNLIEDNTLNGVQVVNSSSATLHGNTIQRNGIGMDAEGVFVRQSTLRLVGGNVIKSNASGIFARASHVRTGDGGFGITPYTDEISENLGDGIGAADNSTLDLRGGNTVVTDHVTIANNRGSGIFLNHGSVLDMRQTTVSGTIANTLTGSPGNGILLVRRSSARFRSSNTVTGNAGFGLSCVGAESSFDGGFSGGGNGFGDISPGCTGF